MHQRALALGDGADGSGDKMVLDHTIHTETRLPPRFYVPMADVRTDLLRPSETRSHCPYKGEASSWPLGVAGRRYGQGHELGRTDRNRPPLAASRRRT